ncbi:MAG: glutamyl-tRNA reductase [Chloroflexi bacterium]|nr:MAG: glutamyl-tRNA reductase [Chloroflexota bacterium]
MKILLVGLNHKTAPVEIRERLSFSAATLRSALTHFDANHTNAHLEHIREGVILSTCNRLEVYALVHNPEIATQAIIDFLSQSREIAPEQFVDYLYVYNTEEAVHHLMQVAAGLDSMVLGEPQILGQITTAYEAALAQRAAGTVMSKLFMAAIHAGKRARTETGISVNASSISSVAAGLAVELLGDLSRQQVLLIGAGEMGAIAVRALIKRGATDIVVANRTFKNAEQLAKAWDGKAITFQELPDALISADIVITSTGAPHTILNRRLLRPTTEARNGRPLFIIDIAVPRDVDPDVSELPNVYLHDIDDLQSQAEQNVRERESEIPMVEAIVQEESAKFTEWLSSLSAVATISALRKRAEILRQNELERLFNRLDLNEHDQELVKTMSHRLINKILHEPTIRLKKETSNGNGAIYTSVVRELFL